ncbi:hypothetical protein [Treponema sp.]|uniref:hypothetical protein n=1 Tax=Treponema sp. TaxID=166 RepID=UPI00388F4F87
MKKLIAAASALALTAGLAFAETHETLKAHTLQTSVGDISFGAWGRSTFEFGHRSDSTKITADTTATGEAAITAATDAMTAYETAKANGTVSSMSAYGVTSVELAADNSNYTEYATAVATYAGVVAASAGGDGTATGAAVGDAMTAYALVTTMKGLESDTSDSSNYAALNPDWSYGNRIGFWIIGRTPDQKFGFDFNLDADGRALFVHKLWDSTETTADTNYNEDGKYAVAIGDQAKIWGLFDNPLFQTKVAFGRMREQVLRGTIGDFGQRESSEVKSEDDIFQEIWTATGLFASVTGNQDSVLNGFYANASIDPAGLIGITTDEDGNLVSSSDSATDTDSSKSIPLYKAVRNFQGGIGYTIPGLAQIKAQYWGDSIDTSNYRYATSTYKTARDEGFGMNDYYGRMEFGIDFLGFMGGATSFLDPNLDLEKTPNANLIELGFKVPIVTDEDLRDYDPEKFYNWYSCLGTMGVIQKGFILYKAHLWGGQGVSNLEQYSYDLITMDKGDGADIFMAGVDFLTEICMNPFGKQDVFLGLSGNYNITSASAEGGFTYGGNSLSIEDLELRQHKFSAEIYVKKTFASNNFMFAGLAGDFTIQSMEGTVNSVVDLSYKSSSKKFYMPIGVELFF